MVRAERLRPRVVVRSTRARIRSANGLPAETAAARNRVTWRNRSRGLNGCRICNEEVDFAGGPSKGRNAEGFQIRAPEQISPVMLQIPFLKQFLQDPSQKSRGLCCRVAQAHFTSLRSPVCALPRATARLRGFSPGRPRFRTL